LNSPFLENTCDELSPHIKINKSPYFKQHLNNSIDDRNILKNKLNKFINNRRDERNPSKNILQEIDRNYIYKRF